MGDEVVDDDEAEKRTAALSGLSFPVVGIGASAGGLEALIRFFENAPSGCGMAFVVILHLSPKHQSNAPEILQRATRMPVSQVIESVVLEPDHVYVISPNRQLTMNDGHLDVSELRRPRGQPLTIDLFLRTLAQAHRSRAIAIVLSGSGSDGAAGLASVKEQGGVTLAQAPEDSGFDGMPKSAIAAGSVDFVLPVVDMPQKLLQIWSTARHIELPPADTEPLPGHRPDAAEKARLAEDALRDIMNTLRARSGHDFRHYKRATVLRRIERRLQVNGLLDLPSYRDFLNDNLTETGALLQDMLISVTNFFRDRATFDALEREIITALFEKRLSSEQVRVWVPACASGEEAYSVAMLLCEHAARMAEPPAIQVFATDIDEAALAAGRAGLYPASIVNDITPGRLRQFFDLEQGQYRVKKTVRDKILFAAHNVLRDPPFSRLDLICCRNLLIYIDREVQVEILDMFHFALRPGGCLMLGTSESAEAAAQRFSLIDKKNRIYRANAIARIGRQVPKLPLGAFEKKWPQGTARATEKSVPSFAELHQQAVTAHLPPSVLIDAEHDIVHLSETAGRFLRHVGGAPSRNLIALVVPELRLELRAALFQTAQKDMAIESRSVEMMRDGVSYAVKLMVEPVKQGEQVAAFTLVLFNESTLDASDQDVPEGRADNPLLRQLEQELHGTKEQLQDVIEQSESSTEELKASNEELQAINEELRSASEELETSREEMQSINEELTTVNFELKNKVEETAQVNDDLHNLIASTDIGTIFVDGGMHIKRYTPSALNIFKLIPSDIGRSLFDITHRLDYDQLTDDAAEVFQRLQPIEREVQGSDGKWYIARLLPYRTAEDRIGGAVLTFIDISRRRRAEELLMAGEERLRLVAESTRDYAIVTMDENGIVSSWNKGAEWMFGYAEGEIIGRPADGLYLQQDRDSGAPEAERERARKDGRAEEERWQLRKDGTQFFSSRIITPLGEGGRQGFAIIARDLTAAKLMEAERESLLEREKAVRAQAQAANATKDEFLAVMSHELKHPLNLIQVNAELVARLPEVRAIATVTRAAEVIRRAVAGQAKIIDDMLDLSRMQTGKLTLDKAPVDLKIITQNIVNAVQFEAGDKGVNITLAMTESSLIIEADVTRIEQVVWNLLSNAIKFTFAGGTIALRLSCEGALAKLEVSDSGIGMSPETIEHVFEMFRQADARTTRQHGGLGIGLALVQQIVQLHGGRVLATSAGLNRGACLSVWLPLHQGVCEVPAVPVDLAETIRGLRILMVDDAIDSLESFRELLSLEGASVTTAESGEAALAVAQTQPFDLLLSDIGMPGIDGYELITRFRRLDRTAHVPAIAITGYGQSNDVARARKAGFDGHIGKPVDFEALVRMISSLVSVGKKK